MISQEKSENASDFVCVYSGCEYPKSGCIGSCAGLCAKYNTTNTPEPEIVKRVMRRKGKSLNEARNPSITARECIELADYIAALQAERERAERWEEEAKRHCRNSDNWRERAEKAAAERDQLRAELAALKGAIKAEASHNPFCSIGHLAEHGSLYKFI